MLHVERLFILPLLLPVMLDAFGATYPGSFYGMLLRLGQARDRKLARTAPSPARIWAYHDPHFSGHDSVYDRATEEARGMSPKKHQAPTIHKPARLRYNSKSDAVYSQKNKPIVASSIKSVNGGHHVIGTNFKDLPEILMKPVYKNSSATFGADANHFSDNFLNYTNVGESGANVGGNSVDVLGSGGNVAGTAANIGGSGANVVEIGAQVGGTEVKVGETGAKVGGTDVKVGGTEVKVGGTEGKIGGSKVKVGGTEVKVGGTVANFGYSGEDNAERWNNAASSPAMRLSLDNVAANGLGLALNKDLISSTSSFTVPNKSTLERADLMSTISRPPVIFEAIPATGIASQKSGNFSTNVKPSDISFSVPEFPINISKRQNQKEEKIKFSNQLMHDRREVPIFHPLRPTLSPSDIQKRNEFYEKFKQEQAIQLKQATDEAQMKVTSSSSVPVGDQDDTSAELQVAKTNIINEQINQNNSRNLENQILKKRLKINDDNFVRNDVENGESDEYDQLMYLQELKENQKQLIEIKNKTFHFSHSGSINKTLVNKDSTNKHGNINHEVYGPIINKDPSESLSIHSNAFERDVDSLSEDTSTNIKTLRRQNLHVPQSFINSVPITKKEVPNRPNTNSHLVSPTDGIDKESWIQRKQLQSLSALQQDSLQQLVLHRQRIALQHLQRNGQPQDDGVLPIKPFLKGSWYRRAEDAEQTNPLPGDDITDNSVDLPDTNECGGQFLFELDPVKFSAHPHERAFFRSLHTPGYGSRRPYQAGLVCSWTVQIGPSCEYGMLVYSLAPSFIRRSHACSEDHLDVVYNGDRVSRYCGPLSRQQKVSGAQIWSTSVPKNLTLVFRSAPRRRKISSEHNWGVGVDVAAFCWGYSDAFKKQLAALKETNYIITPTSTSKPILTTGLISATDNFTEEVPTATKAENVAIEESKLPEAILNVQFTDDFDFSTASSTSPTTPSTKQTSTQVTPLVVLSEDPNAETTHQNPGDSTDSIEASKVSLTTSSSLTTTSASTGVSKEPNIVENLANSSGHHKAPTPPKVTDAVVTILETAPQASHISHTIQAHTVPIDKIQHIPIHVFENQTPLPHSSMDLATAADLFDTTYVNINTNFVQFPPSTNTSIKTGSIDNNQPIHFGSEATTESTNVIKITVDYSHGDKVPIKELAADSFSTAIDLTTLSSVLEVEGNTLPEISDVLNQNENYNVKGEQDETINFESGTHIVAAVPTVFTMKTKVNATSYLAEDLASTGLGSTVTSTDELDLISTSQSGGSLLATPNSPDSIINSSNEVAQYDAVVIEGQGPGTEASTSHHTESSESMATVPEYSKHTYANINDTKATAAKTPTRIVSVIVPTEQFFDAQHHTHASTVPVVKENAPQIHKITTVFTANALNVPKNPDEGIVHNEVTNAIERFEGVTPEVNNEDKLDSYEFGAQISNISELIHVGTSQTSVVNSDLDPDLELNKTTETTADHLEIIDATRKTDVENSAEAIKIKNHDTIPIRVSNKRVNRRDPDRVLRGTMHGRGPLPGLLFDSHRFRRFPW
ncbi:uncharacterized protein LOC108672767 [Hyalella azteca]|uniref:Uncharacterized protein LOC108672767 n=1 Tax=Hyalella azteca TaxID=294128 RepID=A0A979FK68_HYAAZ|nr:uncharacterized protein LOC108672767 [Hyalella azteca]